MSGSAVQKRLLMLSLVGLIAIVGYTFYFVGSPAHQRAVKQDQQKLQDLQHLSCVAENYFNAHDEVPADMEAIQSYHAHLTSYANRRRTWDGCHCYTPQKLLYDDEQGNAYEYIASQNKASGAFQLCGVFNVDGQEYRRHHHSYFKWVDEFKKGRHCFNLKLKKCEKKDN